MLFLVGAPLPVDLSLHTCYKFVILFQMLRTELNREPGDNPGRARRCNRGRPLHESH